MSASTYSAPTKEAMATNRAYGSTGVRKSKALSPKNMNKKMNAIHARAPNNPSVTNDVGMNPMPEVKSTFQKIVLFRERSRNLSHCCPNVLGPEPKIGEEA